MHWNGSRDQRRGHEEAEGGHHSGPHPGNDCSYTQCCVTEFTSAHKADLQRQGSWFVFPRESKLHQTSCNVSLFLCFLPWEPNVLHHCFKHIEVLLLWAVEKAGGLEQSRVQAGGEFLKSQDLVKQLFSHWYWSIILSTFPRNVASFSPTDTEKKGTHLFTERGKQDKRR